jgi:hypothetical protein
MQRLIGRPIAPRAALPQSREVHRADAAKKLIELVAVRRGSRGLAAMRLLIGCSA